MEKLESEVTLQTQEYDGFYHFYTINKKTDKVNFIGSTRKGDEKGFKDDLSVNKNLDYFITKNTFKVAKTRSNDMVLGLNAIVIDIDFHNLKKTNQRQAVDTISNYLMNERHSLKFSHIVDSGRGVQVHIKIEQTSYVLAWLYKKITEDICNQFKKELDVMKEMYTLNYDIDVDVASSINISGLVRLENTINTISKTNVSIIYDTNNIFDLNDLIEDIEIEKLQNNKEFSCDTFTRNLCNSRIRYLYSKDHVIEIGNRMKSLFLLYNNLVQVKSKNDARNDILRFNKLLTKPLKINELDVMMNYINKKGFLKFKQSTFLEWCGGETIETRAVKRKNNKQAKELRNKKMLAMLKDKTITYEQIAEALDVTSRTVKRYAKENSLNRYK